MAQRAGISWRRAAAAQLGLLVLGGSVSWAVWQRSFQAIAWPDECIYLVGARNVGERGALDTSFYLTHSLLRQGHPHRDPHMPGYVLLLSPFVRWLGPTLTAAAALNLIAYLASVLLVFEIADRLLESRRQAGLAAVLFAILPPVPGYLFVAYAEIAITFVLLASLAISLRRGGWATAFLAGFFFGLGGVMRETLLAVLPIHLPLFKGRSLWRGFLPGLASALLLAVLPLSERRAIYPGGALLDDLMQPAAAAQATSTSGLRAAAASVAANLERNIGDVLRARPATSVEDAVLLFLVTLAVVAAFAVPSLTPRARAVALATLFCVVAVTAAAFTLYVVRERQGTWAGVRLLMPLSPLLLIFSVAALSRARSRIAAAAALLGLAAVMLWLDDRQLRFFARYKGSDHEDQSRHARYVESYLDRQPPGRVLGRLFLYGLERWPVEVIWSPPRDRGELQRLERTLGFDFAVVHWKSAQRELFARNPAYLRINRDDRDAELLIFRRLR